MIEHLVYITLLSVMASVTVSSRVVGTFDGLLIPLDFQFGEDTMTITTHPPTAAPSTLRPTTNLHMFTERLVAVKNLKENVCYLQESNATMEEMKQRVQNALTKHVYFEGVKEEGIFTGNMEPMPRMIVSRLPVEIQEFCDHFDIYSVTEKNSQIFQTKEPSPLKRRRRNLSSFWQDYYDDSANNAIMALLYGAGQTQTGQDVQFGIFVFTL